ncbi:MAG: efflux RND transporter periplasmic adaptor subunit [Labilithrix sp.]|nr:efflux RND transporter periplasmic adaptor subunit [Labilithrix sp.]
MKNWSLLVLPLILGCRHAPAASEGDAGAPPPVAVQTADVTEIEVPALLRVSGSLRGFREADLAANASGRVVSTSVERGAQVSAGQELAKLDVRAASLSAAEANAMAESARTQEAQSRVDCERNEKLKAAGAISQAEYDRIATSCRTIPLGAEAATARARLAAQNVGDGIIRAPFAGVVTERFVEVGQFVRQESRVVTVVSVDTLRLEIAIPEAKSAEVKEGADVSFRVAAFPDETFHGKLRFVSGAVRATTRDLVAEAVVENADRKLKPGMFADVELAAGLRKSPSVPREAILQRDGKARAFFVSAGRLEERVLALGAERDGRVAVTKGAAIGEKVAVQDAGKLANGQRVR